MIPLTKLRPNAITPSRAHGSAAAYDLYFAPESGCYIEIPAGQTATLGTGIALALDWGCHTFSTPHESSLNFAPCPHRAALILPRSGLGCKGIRPGNTPGLIDPDYRGEIKVCLRNESSQWATINPGDRIAQLLIIPFLSPGFNLVDSLPATIRAAQGFGSTGD